MCQNNSKSVSFIYTCESDKSRFLIFIYDLGDNLNCVLFESESTDCLSGQTSKNPQNAVGNVRRKRYLERFKFKMSENRKSDPELHLPL